MGNDNAQAFEDLLEGGLDCTKILYTHGEIRQNIIIQSKNHGETRIGYDSFCVDDTCLQRLYELISRDIETEKCIVVLAGKNPKGISDDAICEFLLKIKQSGALLVIDSNSFGVQQLCAVSPWLIKPNESEIQALCGQSIQTHDKAMLCAKELCKKGIQNVFVTLGQNGSVFASKEFCAFISTPKIVPLSTVGAGDSVIAGFCAAFSEGREITECLKYAVAFGSAACLTNGSLPPDLKDVNSLVEKVKVQKE